METLTVEVVDRMIGCRSVYPRLVLLSSPDVEFGNES